VYLEHCAKSEEISFDIINENLEIVAADSGEKIKVNRLLVAPSYANILIAYKPTMAFMELMDCLIDSK
jgi:hypothetical protein